MGDSLDTTSQGPKVRRRIPTTDPTAKVKGSAFLFSLEQSLSIFAVTKGYLRGGLIAEGYTFDGIYWTIQRSLLAGSMQAN